MAVTKLEDLRGLDMLEIKSLPRETLEALTAAPRPADPDLAYYYGNARYALSLHRAPARPSNRWD